MTSPVTGADGAADLPDYAPIPRSALGPALNDQRYYVGRVERNLYWVTDGVYQSAFLTTRDGVVVFDAPPSIGHNLRLAVDEIAAANGLPNTVTHFVYSHHHADHAGAASLFGGDVVRIGHEETRRLLLRDDDPARPAPEVTFTERYTLEVGGERAELAGTTMETKREVDVLMSRENLQSRVTGYTAGQDAALGLISPIFADLSGLPPLIIQAGTHEVLLDDAVRLARQAATADVEVTLDITPLVPHVFQTFYPILDEAAAALDRAGQLLSAHLTGSQTTGGSEQLSEIKGVARFKFHEGKVEEFKRLSAQAMDIVRAKDTGTLQYEIYLNEDQSECVVYERYRDSEAVIEHGAHVGHLNEAIFATGSVSSELLGEPSAELTAMIAGSGIPLFRPFLSM